jgi:hypothetical protein
MGWRVGVRGDERWAMEDFDWVSFKFSSNFLTGNQAYYSGIKQKTHCCGT